MGIYHEHLSLIPPNESDRLRRLYKYDILNTPSEDTFDKIAGLARDLFQVSGAFICFVDEKEIFRKSDIAGQSDRRAKREDSLCSWLILQEGDVMFNSMDMARHILIDPAKMKAMGINFYAATPLQTPDGYRIGALCVTDPAPQYPSEEQLRMLNRLGSVVMDQLKFRLDTRQAAKVQHDLMETAVHDLKNPLTSIKLYAQLIQRDNRDPQKTQMMVDRIIKSADYILTHLNDLLNLSQIEDGAMKLLLKPCSLNELFKEILTDFDVIVRQKAQRIVFSSSVERCIQADTLRLRDVFENLLSNASKYSHAGSTIYLQAEERQNQVFIEVKDEGQGLSEDDMEKLFRKFARLSSIPTGKEGSNGLGLSIVKTLVELHNGKVWAESPGKGKGASFFVTLPVR